MQKTLHRIFYEPGTRRFSLTNDFFALVTIVAIGGIVLETVTQLDRFHVVFLTIEYVSVFLFAVEYVGRVVATKKPLSYVFSFFGLIDLVSILPTLLGLANFSFIKGARILRILRLFRLLRLVRVAHTRIEASEHASGHDEDFDIHTKSFWLKIEIYVIVFVIAALGSASAIWYLEGDRELFANIPLAMLWSTKVLLGGAQSAGAQGVSGEIVIILTRFMGLILFGLLINIIGGVLRKVLFNAGNKS